MSAAFFSFSVCGLALANDPFHIQQSESDSRELKTMESNITEQQYLAADLQLSEPHFEEEATLLSARPVVPLHEVKAEERSGRRLTIGLALVAALVVGALGATLVYKQRSQTAATATEETTTPVANEQAATDASANAVAGGVAGGIVADPPQAASGVAENSSEAADRDARNDARNIVTTRPRKPETVVVRHSDPDKPAAPRRDEAVRDDVVLEDEKAARRAERIEARRLRQEAAREARQDGRRRRARRSDDLLRIREIFEGPRRP